MKVAIYSRCVTTLHMQIINSIIVKKNKNNNNNNIICSDPNKGLQLEKNPRKITSRLNRTLKFCILVTFDYNNQSPSGLRKTKPRKN